MELSKDRKPCAPSEVKLMSLCQWNTLKPDYGKLQQSREESQWIHSQDFSEFHF